MIDNSKATIRTFTGKTINLIMPKEEDIDILDIAHGLSNVCRYNGHCSKFYSVAEHSVLLSYKYGLAALMHDASEAYLGDLVSPLKKFTTLGKIFIPIEKKMEKVISSKFQLGELTEEFDQADKAFRMVEKNALFGEKFSWREEHYNYDYDFSSLFDIVIYGWLPEDAEFYFLKRYYDLTVY